MKLISVVSDWVFLLQDCLMIYGQDMRGACVSCTYNFNAQTCVLPLTTVLESRTAFLMRINPKVKYFVVV